jgi:hypothetical protein
MSKLTCNVFLDTCVYDRCNFDLSCRDFLRLTSLVAEGYVHVFLTTVTKREIEAHIDKRAREASTALKTFADKARLISPLSGPFEAIPVATDEGLKKAFQQSFREFCKKLNIEVIAVPNMSLEGVLDDYFEQRPPFSEKKKSEFPDAFAAAALEAWCKKKSEKILVISGDGDWPIICEGSDVLTYCRFQLTTFAS